MSDAFGQPMQDPHGAATATHATTATHAGSQAGGFWPRFGAAIIDSLIVNALGLALIFVGSAAGDVGTLVSFGIIVLASLLYAPVLMARQGANNGQTVGKQALGLRVVREDGTPVGFGTGALREVVGKSIINAFVLPALASLVMVLVRDDKRTVHDLLASTRVVRA